MNTLARNNFLFSGWLHSSLHVETVSEGGFPVFFLPPILQIAANCKKFPSGSKWWLPLQELKIRKGTGRGRGRRSRREADVEDLEETENKEEKEEYYVDEGDFGFVEVGEHIVLEWGISSKVENADGERERARRAALLDWDGDYSHFQRDEVQPVVTCQYIGTCHQDDLQDVKKFPKVNFWSRQRRRRRSHLQNQSTSESAGDYRRFFPFLLFWKNFTLNFICVG